ncbi:MAG TPA: ABC transporter permease [Candidatus Saccharimonadales bacterium]|nr:ABC transporter permease [Candidatus Saccharimonadales bacterium]
MRFIDYLAIALRNIRRSKLRSALTIFAVVIGATSVTIMLAAVFSLKGFMTKQFEANGTFQQVAVSPQTDISWDDHNNGNFNCQDCVKLTDDLATKIATVQHVTGVARQTQVGAFQAIEYGGQKLRTQQVTAYDANGIIKTAVLAGRDIQTTDTTGVLTVSSDYADKFGFKHNYDALIGKQVTLITQSYYNGVGANPLQQFKDQQAWFSTHQGQDGRDYQPTPITLTGKIVGITDAGDQNFNIRVPLDWARGMEESQTAQVTQADQDAAQAACRNQHTPSGCNTQPVPSKVTVEDELAKQGYSSFIVKVDQSSNAAAVAKTIKNTYKVGAADAQTQIKQQLSIFNILGLVLGGIGGIALVVAAVGVVNTMVMSILERTREIGVMRAVGARRGTVSLLFTIEAALLGFFGGVVGLGVGYGAVVIANPIINKQLSGNNITSSNIIGLPIWLILGVIALTTVIGILAGLYPARRAAHLDPVEALRYE